MRVREFVSFYAVKSDKKNSVRRGREESSGGSTLSIITEILAFTESQLFPGLIVLQSRHLFKKGSPQMLSMLSKVRRFLRFSMRSAGAKTLLIAVAAAMLCVGTAAAAWDYDSIAVPSNSPLAQRLDVGEVNRTLLGMVERWNAHDLDGFLDYFWKSPDLTVVTDAQQYSGWQELHDSYMRGFHNRDEMGELLPSRVQIRMVRPDLAFALTYWTIRFPVSKHISVGIDTSYLQRFGSEWKIISVHTSMADM